MADVRDKKNFSGKKNFVPRQRKKRLSLKKKKKQRKKMK
jgi:hypothetical protein